MDTIGSNGGGEMVRETVKQGTVYSPKLCCGSSGKVNVGLNVEKEVYPTVVVKAVTYVMTSILVVPGSS